MLIEFSGVLLLFKAIYQTHPPQLRFLLFMLVAAGLLPLALLGVWSVNAVYEQQQNDLRRGTLDLSRALSSAVNAEIESSVAALETLSYHPALAAGRYEEFHSVARNAAMARPYWVSVILSDASGQPVFRSSRPFGSVDPGVYDPDSMKRVLEEKRPLAGMAREGSAGTAAIPVRVPVMVGGEMRYVITAALKLDRIDDILARQNVPDGWAISVADSGFQRVARSRDREQFVGKRLSESFQRDLSNAKTEGISVTPNAAGVESIVGFTKLPRWGLSVIVGAPTSSLHNVVSTALYVYATTLALSLLVCLLVAKTIARRIVGGIATLQMHARDLGQGRAVKAQSCGIAEFDQLSKSLETASMERLAVEGHRRVLVDNLDRSLRSIRAAMEQAREASAAKDHFLAVLGHELRNPLAPIVSTLDLMDIQGKEVYRRERQILRRQATHLHHLVDDLLDVSRIVQGKLTVEKQPVLLNVVVARAHEAIASTVPNRVAPFSLVLPPDEIWVHGDEERLTQLVVNLLINAVRSSAEASISVSLSATASAAMITVSDQGVGMTPDTLAKVFTLFYQAPQSIARSAGGLGLGLSIARSIVHLHEGHITASSDGLGLGAKFRIDLPLLVRSNVPPQADSHRQAALPSRSASPPERFSSPVTPSRILVIDDNVDAATTIAEALSASGHEVRVRHTASECLSILPTYLPDVALLDIGLPDMDGLNLAQLIRASGQFPNLVLIAITGYGQREDVERAMHAGFDQHMTKPVPIGELLARVDALQQLRGRSEQAVPADDWLPPV
ncbi:hypothetical protein GCM10007242_18310 [Pigmentiphaga litoralis]|uniref:hybrid sensor histidine kinase/response regulator n=1 Tax=Pigmentiphaga litoralis TaxID=516702 RepID=UPI0016748412|nr:ATP-binding protein [Pigmentiphaga litoralis]GGX12378.1 hypothetical protein GCM10007242_18310 [Pigmentiphaga litoralis]